MSTGSSLCSRRIFLVCLSAVAFAADPPANLARLTAERETETEAARASSTYNQLVLSEVMRSSGVKEVIASESDILDGMAWSLAQT